MSECKVYVGGREIDPEAREFHEYRKTALARAVRMEEPFAVQTLEGRMEGAAGDYLMLGAAGELYPCAASIFHSTYEAA